jgi:hypothetical protein
MPKLQELKERVAILNKNETNFLDMYLKTSSTKKELERKVLILEAQETYEKLFGRTDSSYLFILGALWATSKKVEELPDLEVIMNCLGEVEIIETTP